MSAARRAVLTLAGALLLGGCTDPVREGVVVEKSHRDEWNQVVSAGRTGTRILNHPERWRLHLRDDEGRAGRVNVSEETWRGVTVGEYFDGGAG